jgi:hypothetical protein
MQLALAVVLLIASFGTTSAECAEVLWKETEHSGPGSLATPKGSEVLRDHRRRLGAESVPGSVAGDVAGRIKDTRALLERRRSRGSQGLGERRASEPIAGGA